MYKHLIALSLILTLAVHLLPAPSAHAVPQGAEIFFFVSNEAGERYYVKSNGDGTFEEPVLAITYGKSSRGGAIEDYNGDGKLDYVGCSDIENRCHLFIQTAPGTFEQSTNIAPETFSIPTAESGMSADDFNNDGNADIIFGGYQTLASVHFGDGNGNFPTNIPNLPVSVGFSYLAKESVDLAKDGYPDLLLTTLTRGTYTCMKIMSADLQIPQFYLIA